MNLRTRLDKLDEDYQKWLAVQIEKELARFPEPGRSELIALAQASPERVAELWARVKTFTHESGFSELSEDDWDLMIGASLAHYDSKSQSASHKAPSSPSSLIESRLRPDFFK